jgi:iron complex outermembrane receptor protein
MNRLNNRMNRLLLILLLLVGTVAAHAQGSVRGKIADKARNEPLEFVNVSVFQQASNKLVKGAITDGSGSFNIKGLANGNYVLNVSFVGYKTVKRNFVISDSKKDVHYLVIYLTDDTHSLKEVQVVGQKSTMKLEVDKKSFNVDQSIAAAGGSATDALQSIPSVEVDNEGTVSLRGNTSVEVWINGKASGLTSDNRGEILEQMPAESIDKIEVITNPSSKYSAEGSAGIINIVLKRDRKAGYYGSLQAGGDSKGGYNASGNINYTSGLFDAYANVGYRHRKHDGGAWSRQTFTSNNTYQNYDTDNDNTGSNLFGRAGITWHATKNDDVSFSGMTMIGSHDNSSQTPYHYGTVGAATDSHLMYRSTTSNSDMNMFYGELNYRHNFSEKHYLDFTLSRSQWHMDNDNYYQDSTTYFDNLTPSSYDYLYRPMHIRNRMWEAKLDYENEISDKLKLQAGYDGRFNHENSPQESYADSSSFIGNNMSEDKAYFNRFIYDQDVHALYATVTTRFGKLGVQAGLRGEYWKVNAESYTYEQEHDASLRDPKFSKDYFQLFPSLFLSYSLTKSQELQINYTRRLERPWGGQLNSFKNTSDASIVSFGNPLLTPEYTNAFEMNYIKNWEEHTLSLSAYYRPTTDVIQQVRYRNSTDGMMYSTSENVSNSLSTGLEMVLKDKFFKILDLTTTANLYYYKLDGFNYVIDGQTVTGASDDNFSWNARMMANLILPYAISFQATGNYNSRQVISQGYRKANYSVDLGLRKTFLDKKYAIALNVRDLFSSRNWETVTSGDGFMRHQKNWRSGCRVNFTFTYSFGNMKSKKPQHQQNQNEGEEDQQINGGYGTDMQ